MHASEKGGTRATLLAFGHLLKRLRLAAQLTQEELAERAMVSARSISDLERGSPHRPRRDTVQLLADGLGLCGEEREAFIALARGKTVALPQPDARAAPHTLPHPPTDMIGRLKESAAATALVLDPAVRLLTLTGPGGVGKTRLALDVAVRAADVLADGAVFVDLSSLRNPELVLSAIAQTLDVPAAPESSLRDAVYAALREKRLLLVLDNFEHLLPAARTVAEILAACPAVTVLATSRTPLRIRAEREYVIAPLPLPDQDRCQSPEELVAVPAVELFVRRAESADPQFALTARNAADVAALVTRLDGLPLAIELAANRMKILSPAALLARMEQRLPLLTRGAHDLPVRQQAMRATLDWSHDLLTPEEQTLFRRLAVFAGGFTLEAAESVGGACLSPSPPIPLPPSTLDLIASLVDHSLLRRTDDGTDEPRFLMLETIREYGLEQLALAGEAADARRGHADWCVALARRAEPELIGANQQRWFARLLADHDNLRAALGWAIAERDAETAQALAGSLYRFWATEGLYEEGRRWLEQALAVAPQVQTASRGNALLGLGVMCFFQGEYDQAAALWEASLVLFTALDDRTGIAYSHGNLGLIADAREEYDRATAEYEAALALFRALDDQKFVAYMLHNLGLIAYFQGEYQRATALFEESLVAIRAFGDRNSIAMTLGNLGLVAFAEGDYPRALALQREALADRQLISNKPWLARTIENFAQIAAATDQPDRAVRLFAAAAALRAAFGASLPPNDRALNDRHLALAQSQLSNDRFAVCWADGDQLSLEHAIQYALGDNEC